MWSRTLSWASPSTASIAAGEGESTGRPCPSRQPAAVREGSSRCPARPGRALSTFWLLMLYAAFTMLTIAHLLGAELATGYDARSELYGWREIFTIAGMTLVLALPQRWNWPGSKVRKVRSPAWGSSPLFPRVPWCLCCATCARLPRKSQSSLPLKAALKLLVGNPLLWRLLTADLLAGLGTAVSGALYIFVAIAYFRLPTRAWPCSSTSSQALSACPFGYGWPIVTGKTAP